MLGLRGALPGPRRLMFDQNWGSVGPGCVGAVTLAYVGPSWGYVGAMLAQLRSMLGPGSPILGLCWGYFGSCGGYVGAMFAQVILGLCCVHEFTFIPKFCLKKLSPVACEAPIPFVQRHVSEKVESCWGRQTAQPDFVSKTLLLPGTGNTKMVYVGLSWGSVGLGWGHVRPS